MNIEIKIDNSCKEPKIIIVTATVNDTIKELVKKLAEDRRRILAGFRGETLEILQLQNISRIYAMQGKVFAVCNDGEYLLKMRLYELEEQLKDTAFVRISNSEIINLHKVKRFDLSYAGTICVVLTDGSVTYVSRRYVSKIKQVLGI